MNGRWRTALGFGLLLHAAGAHAGVTSYGPTPGQAPPGTVHGAATTDIDGVYVAHRTSLFGITTPQSLYGRGQADPPRVGEADAGNLIGLLSTIKWGAAWLYVSFNTAGISSGESLPPLEASGDDGAPGVAIADRSANDDERVNLLRTGLRYDPGRWFATADWARLDTRSFLPDSRGLYFSGGFRFEAFTPYWTVARLGVASDNSAQRLTIRGLPAGDKRRVPDFHSALNALLTDTAQQSRVAAGVRWNVARRLALQAQYDHLGLEAGAPNLPVNKQSGFQPGSHHDMFSVSLDLAF